MTKLGFRLDCAICRTSTDLNQITTFQLLSLTHLTRSNTSTLDSLVNISIGPMYCRDSRDSISFCADWKPKGNLDEKERFLSLGRKPFLLHAVWMKASVNFDLTSF